MNKLEICITELDEKLKDAIPIGVKSVVHLEFPRIMCIEYFKMAIIALEKADKDVFMDALELYLHEKSGKDL